MYIFLRDLSIAIEIVPLCTVTQIYKHTCQKLAWTLSLEVSSRCGTWLSWILSDLYSRLAEGSGHSEGGAHAGLSLWFWKTGHSRCLEGSCTTKQESYSLISEKSESSDLHQGKRVGWYLLAACLSGPRGLWRCLWSRAGRHTEWNAHSPGYRTLSGKPYQCNPRVIRDFEYLEFAGWRSTMGFVAPFRLL